MALTETPACNFGAPAPDFELPGVDGRRWTLADCRGNRATLVMFICNHCPYVKAIRERLVRDAKELLEFGVKSVAIMPNDTAEYPEDSFANMQREAEQFGYPFPYLLDESQEVARAYGAVCTPDFFGYNSGLRLQFRARPARAEGRAAGTVRCHARRSGDRARSREAGSEHGLLDKMALGMRSSESNPAG
jgi:peroxiredoxin